MTSKGHGPNPAGSLGSRQDETYEPFHTAQEALVVLGTAHSPPMKSRASSAADGHPPVRDQKSVRIMFAGSQSGAGKSTCCLAFLGSLLEAGYHEDELAYIKPATQGVQGTLVARWCDKKGIACRHIGPLVFYKGFTQRFLDTRAEDHARAQGTALLSPNKLRRVLSSHSIDEGEERSPLPPTLPTAVLLQEIRKAIDSISEGKRVTVVDGVGYPSVGSVVGVSNADVAREGRCSVLIVGKQGLGDAIDSFNLCKCWFESRKVPVVGCVFNRVGGDAMMQKTKYVHKYFATNLPKMRVYGILGENEQLKLGVEDYAPPGLDASCGSRVGLSCLLSRCTGEINACTVTSAKDANKAAKGTQACTPEESSMCDKWISFFADQVDARSIVADAKRASSVRLSSVQPIKRQSSEIQFGAARPLKIEPGAKPLLWAAPGRNLNAGPVPDFMHNSTHGLFTVMVSDAIKSYGLCQLPGLLVLGMVPVGRVALMLTEQ
eukprot:gene5968-1062_t